MKIIYGSVVQPLRYAEVYGNAALKNFPFAESPSNPGCSQLSGMPTVELQWCCAECNDARARWLSENYKLRDEY